MSEDSVEVISFGCRLNGVESDEMRGLALAAGHRDLTIVNTCAVTAEAVRQSRQAIRRAGRDTPHRPIVVTGCAATIDEASFSAMPEVARLVQNRAKVDPASWIGWSPASGRDAALGAAMPPDEIVSASRHTRGFLEVQNGCDHRCTFCVIPFGRGASRSIAPPLVLDRARALVEAGAREIVLTGVDVTSYGGDLPDGVTLGRLVTALLRALPELDRLRVSSIDCIEADAALLDAIAHEPRLMPHLHLSLQSGSDLILKRMKRRHGRADAVAFCGLLRSLRPDMVLGADMITGFPTETEAHFEESLSLVNECGLTHLHVFPYSPRPGTPAARMPAVRTEIARERAARLRAEGDAALVRHLAREVGHTRRLLMERGGLGRTATFTPVRVHPAPLPGSMIDAIITAHDGRTLQGRQVAS